MDAGPAHTEGMQPTQVLKDAPVGKALVWTCGYVYENKGVQYLGGAEAVASNARQAAHTAAAQMRVAGAAISTYKARHTL